MYAAIFKRTYILPYSKMNFLTCAIKLNKKIDKDIARFQLMNDDPLPEDFRANLIDREMRIMRRDMELGINLMLMYKEIATEKGLIQETPSSRNYFITIRPDNRATFDMFYAVVHRYVNRACFKNYTLSFEQKGVTEETLGNGFHVHIVAHMTQRSKQEVLRDTQSTFKHCAAPHCIDVTIAKTPDAIIQNYLIDYKAEDDHKIATKQWDEKWRLKENLASLYRNELPTRTASLSSPFVRLLSFN